MRPTFLQFRSPKEKTPEFYSVGLTSKGDMLNFQTKSLNQKQTKLPQAERFPNRDFGDGGDSCFIGPGRYNDGDNFSKQVKRPCSSIMKKITALPPSESGKPCYIMVGNNLQCENAYLATYGERKAVGQLSGDCQPSINASLQQRSISELRGSMRARTSNQYGSMQMKLKNVEQSIGSYNTAICREQPQNPNTHRFEMRERKQIFNCTLSPPTAL